MVGMALVPFANAQQMADRSQGAIPTDHPFLADELEAASRTIRNYCGWHIAPVETVTVNAVGPFVEDVWLPASQITGVTAATIDGTELDVSTVEFDPATGWTNMRGRRRVVVFTAGYETVPGDIVTLTLQMTARALGSPLGIVREQAGAVSVTYSQVGFNQAGGMLLLPAEKEALTEYRLGWLP